MAQPDAKEVSIAVPATGPCQNRAADATPERADVWQTQTSMRVSLSLGQALRIDLAASPAMGYEWALDGVAPPLLRMESDPGQSPASHLGTRTGNMQSWRFRAERSGQTVLRFTTEYSGGASSIQMRTAQFEIIVR